jgi:hypothetical protein
LVVVVASANTGLPKAASFREKSYFSQRLRPALHVVQLIVVSSMGDINSLLSSLDEISKQLFVLAEEHENAFEGFQGSDFPEQNTLAAVKLDNLISESTDLLAMYTIEKQKQIKDLVSYIEFRRKHQAFSDLELCRIIDFDNHLTDFKKHFHMAAEGQEFLKKLKEVRVEWNLLFENRPYLKVRQSISK